LDASYDETYGSNELPCGRSARVKATATALWRPGHSQTRADAGALVQRLLTANPGDNWREITDASANSLVRGRQRQQHYKPSLPWRFVESALAVNSRQQTVVISRFPRPGQCRSWSWKPL